ncbi:MAG TPA: hypothetical protein VMT76_07960 [Puia sp.]|nr:hypothetical protein [Puia sp.]
MENTPGVQQLFFQHIKSSLPQHLSLVDEIAELLNISNDSAYRRIRGEKPVAFDELRILCLHFKISLDQLFHLQSDSFIFSGKLSDNTSNFFDEWMKDVLQKYSYICSFEKKHLYFISKDLPFQSFFQVPELARFKFFLWMRTFLRYEDLRNKKFSIADQYETYEATGKKIIQAYNKIPTTEIWNYECINSTIRQIEFYKEANFFQSKNDVFVLYTKLEELITFIEMQAEAGKKWTNGETPNLSSADYNLYIDELSLGSNTVLAEINNSKLCFLNHSIMNIIGTSDERFNNYIYERTLNIIQKSTQISKVGEKARSRFFNSLREKVDRRKSALKSAV